MSPADHSSSKDRTCLAILLFKRESDRNSDAAETGTPKDSDRVVADGFIRR